MASAQSLIKRFREAKPTSREERRETNTGGRMWWEEDAEEPPPPIRSLTKVDYDIDLRNSLPRRDHGVKFDRSLNIDSMIEEEIRILERDLKSKDFRTSSKLDRSFKTAPTPRKSSLMDSITSDTMRSKNYEAPKLLGLSKSELRLDGSLDPPVAPSTPSMPEMTLEELLKNLNVVFPSKTSEEEEKSIAEIANELNVHMLNFANSYTNLASQQEKLDSDLAEKERKERDEKMREEGRLQERSKRLLDVDLPLLENKNFYLYEASSSNESKVHRSMKAVQLAMHDIDSLRKHYSPKPPKVEEPSDETNTSWNPYPDIVHKNILTTAQGITSILTTTITTLNNLLPEQPPTPPPTTTATAAAAAAAEEVTKKSAEESSNIPQQQVQVQQKEEEAVSVVTAPSSSSSSTNPLKSMNPNECIEFIDRVLMNAPVNNNTKLFPSAKVAVLGSGGGAAAGTSKTYKSSGTTNSILPTNLKNIEQIKAKQRHRSTKKVFFDGEEEEEGEERTHAERLQLQQDVSAPPDILAYEFPGKYSEHYQKENYNHHQGQQATRTPIEHSDHFDTSSTIERMSVPVADATKYASLSPLRRPLEGMSIHHINNTSGSTCDIYNRKRLHTQPSLTTLPGLSSTIVEKENFLKELKQLRMNMQKS